MSAHGQHARNTERRHANISYKRYSITKYFKDVQRLLLISKFSPPSDLMPFPLDDSVLLALCVSLIFDSDETCVLFTSQ